MRKTTVIAALALATAAAGQVHAQPNEPTEPSEPLVPATDPVEQEPAEPTTPPRSAPEAPMTTVPQGTLFPSSGVDTTLTGTQAQPQQDDGAAPEDNSSLAMIFAEDWWSHARPVFEFHGYFRTRAALFHNFSLGRIDPPGRALYPRPSDDQYQSISGNLEGATFGPTLCTSDGGEATGTNLTGCENKSQTGANLRFRLNPTLHVSDNLRVQTQVDILDNVVFGAQPEGYQFRPASSGGYEVLLRNGYTPQGYLDNTLLPPESGINSLQDSIRVKRAWAEYATPLGELRFGRMPNHWGLGMVANAGDGPDQDAQSTMDRIMFASGVKLLDLTVAAMIDFPNEGPTYQAPFAGSEAYDRAQLDDVDQYGLILLRTKDPELTKLALAKGETVVNSGLYLTYRSQLLANDQPGNTGANVPYVDPATLADSGFTRRGVQMWLPDVWLQLLHKKLRVEIEAAAVLGSVESNNLRPNNTDDFGSPERSRLKLRQYGFAFELQQRLVEDRLRLNFNAGWASGDPDAFDPNTAGDLIPGPNERQVNDDTISTFRFHPSYRVDSILNRYILHRIQGTYYFNPSLDYDFSREPNGQRFGGGISATWTRASEFVQTPGHDEDLGLELSGNLYYQSKDGALNDDPLQEGGFFGRLQYAVLFPWDGLDHLALESQALNADTSAAQALSLFLGVMF